MKIIIVINILWRIIKCKLIEQNKILNNKTRGGTRISKVLIVFKFIASFIHLPIKSLHSTCVPRHPYTQGCSPKRDGDEVGVDTRHSSIWNAIVDHFIKKLRGRRPLRPSLYLWTHPICIQFMYPQNNFTYITAADSVLVRTIISISKHDSSLEF